jgi:hypothetical protein
MWLGLLTLGCAALGPEDVLRDASAPFQTGALSYQLSDDRTTYHITIPLTVSNRSSFPLYYDGCRTRLEQKGSDGWTFAFGPTCPAVPARIDTIAPGGTLSTAFSLTACHVAGCEPQLEVAEIPGIYRITGGLFASVLHQGFSFVAQDPLPTSANRSNEFWLAAP